MSCSLVSRKYFLNYFILYYLYYYKIIKGFICTFRPLDAEADDKLVERELEIETPGEESADAEEDDKKDEAEGGDDKDDDAGK